MSKLAQARDAAAGALLDVVDALDPHAMRLAEVRAALLTRDAWLTAREVFDVLTHSSQPLHVTHTRETVVADLEAWAAGDTVRGSDGRFYVDVAERERLALLASRLDAAAQAEEER